LAAKECTRCVHFRDVQTMRQEARREAQLSTKADAGERMDGAPPTRRSCRARHQTTLRPLTVRKMAVASIQGQFGASPQPAVAGTCKSGDILESALACQMRNVFLA
jgi:hypothetical protein